MAARAPSDRVRRIADAVLYEGYLLWPYRRGALKNQQRFTFGGVYPPAWEDRSCVQVQVLLQSGTRISPHVDVSVRFLHMVHRQVLAGGVPVDELEAGGQLWVSWDEAVERELTLGAICISAGEQVEGLPGGALRRSWRALAGEISLGTESVGPGVSRVTVQIANTTPWSGRDRTDALRQTFCAAHVVLRSSGGAWVSLTDPPPQLSAQAQECECLGLWPVLVGEPGDCTTMLAAPIILGDHPQVAPESPGDLFDSGEIDQMLVLNILAMTEQERREMRAADPRAREILERTQALGKEEMMRLHGAVREFGVAQ